MLHAGLDLSRKRLDYCLLDEGGERVGVGVAPPDADGLDGLARRVERRFGPVGVRAAIESMTGARFIHDTLERCGQYRLPRAALNRFPGAEESVSTTCCGKCASCRKALVWQSKWLK